MDVIFERVTVLLEYLDLALPTRRFLHSNLLDFKLDFSKPLKGPSKNPHTSFQVIPLSSLSGRSDILI